MEEEWCIATVANQRMSKAAMAFDRIARVTRATTRFWGGGIR
jgi:hypothetical protein